MQIQQPSTYQRDTPEVLRGKSCTLCREWKLLTQFYSDHRMSDRRQSRCKTCHLKTMMTYYPERTAGLWRKSYRSGKRVKQYYCYYGGKNVLEFAISWHSKLPVRLHLPNGRYRHLWAKEFPIARNGQFTVGHKEFWETLTFALERL